MWVAGADGCTRGWICASRNTQTRELRFDLLDRAAGFLELTPRPEILCVDIPIGLSEQGGRECDRLARALLGWPRRSSVFPAPIRPALAAGSREQASRITQRVDGRRLGAQAWALYPKIREIDDLCREQPEAPRRIHEAHPEVSFRAWNGGKPIEEGKKTAVGRARRLRLAEDWLGPEFLGAARADRTRRDLGDDDILDAIAVLWTATRLAAGSAQGLPAVPPGDSTGLRMQIVY